MEKRLVVWEDCSGCFYLLSQSLFGGPLRSESESDPFFELENYLPFQS